MKKLTFLIFGLFFYQILLSQNKLIQVQYESVKGSITNTETLIASNSKAVFLIDSLLINNDENTIIIDEDIYNNKITITQKKIKLDATKFYLENDNQIIYFTENLKGSKVLVKDNLPNYSWNLLDKETKKIGDYLCKKATTIFRGSQIIAWYAEELNVPFGPWKFKGLPGLILELHNTNDLIIHSWQVRKLKFLENQYTIFEKNNGLHIINFEKIIIDMENEIKDNMSRMQTRVPQGVSVSKVKLNRTGIEKKFEWED